MWECLPFLLALQGKEQSFGFQDWAIIKKGAIRYASIMYASPEKFYFWANNMEIMSVIVNNISNEHEWHTLYFIHIYNTICYYSEL